MRNLVGIILLLVLAYTLCVASNIMYKADLELVTVDREYWRAMASSPEWLCRARGGKYKEYGFSTDFVHRRKVNWFCEEF